MAMLSLHQYNIMLGYIYGHLKYMPDLTCNIIPDVDL